MREAGKQGDAEEAREAIREVIREAER